MTLASTYAVALFFYGLVSRKRMDSTLPPEEIVLRVCILYIIAKRLASCFARSQQRARKGTSLVNFFRTRNSDNSLIPLFLANVPSLTARWECFEFSQSIFLVSSVFLMSSSVIVQTSSVNFRSTLNKKRGRRTTVIVIYYYKIDEILRNRSLMVYKFEVLTKHNDEFEKWKYWKFKGEFRL